MPGAVALPGALGEKLGTVWSGPLGFASLAVSKGNLTPRRRVLFLYQVEVMSTLGQGKQHLYSLLATRNQFGSYVVAIVLLFFHSLPFHTKQQRRFQE